MPAAPVGSTLPLLAVETVITIAADPATVFAYATNPARWHEWHPATRSVEPLPDRPLPLGGQVTEHIAVGARRFSATWTVLVADAPQRWVIATETPQGRACITYRLAADGSGTRFERRLEARSTGRWARWLDPLMFRLVLVPQSRRALARLKKRIEIGR